LIKHHGKTQDKFINFTCVTDYHEWFFKYLMCEKHVRLHKMYEYVTNFLSLIVATFHDNKFINFDC